MIILLNSGSLEKEVYKMRAWAEINLDAITNNIQKIKNITSEKTKIMAIVKADAYGHGFFEVASTLATNGSNSAEKCRNYKPYTHPWCNIP